MKDEHRNAIDFHMVGQRIRVERMRQGLMIKDLALKADLDITSLSNFERGERRIGLTSLVLVANALGVTTDFLLFGPDENLETANIENEEKSKRSSSSMNQCSEAAKESIYQMMESMARIFCMNRELMVTDVVGETKN